jgi:hypothetical protein
MVLDHLSGGCDAPRKGYPLGVLTVWVPDGPDLLWRIPPILGELIRCQSDQGDFACSHGGVALLGGDGTDFSTRVPAAWRVWAPVVMSCLVWH